MLSITSFRVVSPVVYGYKDGNRQVINCADMGFELYFDNINMVTKTADVFIKFFVNQATSQGQISCSITDLQSYNPGQVEYTDGFSLFNMYFKNGLNAPDASNLEQHLLNTIPIHTSTNIWLDDFIMLTEVSPGIPVYSGEVIKCLGTFSIPLNEGTDDTNFLFSGGRLSFNFDEYSSGSHTGYINAAPEHRWVTNYKSHSYEEFLANADVLPEDKSTISGIRIYTNGNYHTYDCYIFDVESNMWKRYTPYIFTDGQWTCSTS